MSLIQLSCTNHDILSEKERNWLDEHPNLKAAVNPTYPPYQFINEENNVDGIFVGFVHLIEEKLDYEFDQVIYDDWSEVLKDAKEYKADVILEIQETEDRKAFLNFTPPLVTHPHVLVSKQYQGKKRSLRSFYGQKVGVIKDYALHEYLRTEHPNLALVTVQNDAEGFEKLGNGEVDAYACFQSVANYFINNKNYKNMVIVGEVNYINALGIASRKDQQILSRILNKAVANISSQEKKDIYNNWSYTLVKPTYKQLKFWVTLASLVITLLILTLAINAYLKHRIDVRTAQLRFAKEKAEESDRLKTAFIQNISHEVRTPINGIMGFSDLLNNADLTEEERSKYARIVKNSGNQLVRVIDDILEISKLDTKQIKVHPEITDIPALMYELYSIYEVKVRNTAVDLHLHEQGDVPNTVFIDKSKLRKIVSNLLDNAVNFTTKGSIDLSFSVTGKKLTVSVKDTGKGIPKKELHSIFGRFKQLHQETAMISGGLGLGLSIAKENAKLLGGNISVSSAEGEGSEFIVTVPFGKVNTSETSKSDAQPTEDVKSIKTHNVLIAEDGEVNYLYLKTVLEKMPNLSLNIQRAKNGQEAVDACVANPNIDLVLMDIKMPIMNGYEATKRIRAMRPSLPIVAQTAYTTEEDKQKAKNAGCFDFLSKPIDTEELKPILSKYIS